MDEWKMKKMVGRWMEWWVGGWVNEWMVEKTEGGWVNG